MKRKFPSILALTFFCGFAAAALSVPREVLANLAFFSELDMIMHLDILEKAESGGIKVSTAAVTAAAGTEKAPALSTAAVSVPISTETVRLSTFSRRNYEEE